jgi:hypothetical protein
VNRLAFEAFGARWGAHTLHSITGVTEAPRVALVGDWDALYAVLCAVPEATSSGRATLDGADLREAVVDGRVGIARPGQQLPVSETVDTWLTESLVLWGDAFAKAKQQSNRLLRDLSLGFLGSRMLGSLSPAEEYAARLAFALLTEPKLVFVHGPAVPHSLLPFCQTLLDRAAERTQVCVQLPSEPEFAWWSWFPELWIEQQGGLAYGGATNAWLPTATEYALCLAAEGAGARDGAAASAMGFSSFEEQLRQRQVHFVHLGADRMRVTLPSGGSSDLVLEACDAACVSLAELNPLLFA